MVWQATVIQEATARMAEVARALAPLEGVVQLAAEEMGGVEEAEE